MNRDPYEVLGISRNATDDEVKKAYKTLAKKYHPDVTGNDPESAKKMQEINAAYDQIINHKTSYDTGYGYQERSYQETSSGDPIEMEAAANYINAHRFQEALTALSQVPEAQRNGRWYYLSSMAKYYMGNSIGAMSDINIALSKDPSNLRYNTWKDSISGRRPMYESTSRTYSVPSFFSICLTLLLCRCCCYC